MIRLCVLFDIPQCYNNHRFYSCPNLSADVIYSYFNVDLLWPVCYHSGQHRVHYWEHAVRSTWYSKVGCTSHKGPAQIYDWELHHTEALSYWDLRILESKQICTKKLYCECNMCLFVQTSWSQWLIYSSSRCVSKQIVLCLSKKKYSSKNVQLYVLGTCIIWKQSPTAHFTT